LRFVPLQRLPDSRCAIRSGQAPNDPASTFAMTARASADLSNHDAARAVFRLANAMRGSSTCGQGRLSFRNLPDAPRSRDDLLGLLTALLVI